MLPLFGTDEISVSERFLKIAFANRHVFCAVGGANLLAAPYVKRTCRLASWLQFLNSYRARGTLYLFLPG